MGSDDPARHTKWMKFMYPRLQMMKSMLRPSGVLAICIDHRELFHLGQMLDELFGEENRLAIINWQKSYSPRSDKSHVSTATEYVLVYAKDEGRARTQLLPREADMDARYQARDGDVRVWKSGDLSAGKAAKNQPMVYAIQSPFTGVLHYPPEGRCWSRPWCCPNLWTWRVLAPRRSSRTGPGPLSTLASRARAARNTSGTWKRSNAVWCP